MKMTKEKKKDILLKNFEIIKNNYAKNSESIRDVVVKMFEIDDEMAIDMWQYLLKTYEAEVKNGNRSYFLTSGIVYDLERSVGWGKVSTVLLETPLIKEALFSWNGISDNIYAYQIVRNCIEGDELTKAYELLKSLWDNQYRRDSWYTVMDKSMPFNDSDISENAYDLLDMWCDRVEDEEERAKLSIKMLCFID